MDMSMSMLGKLAYGYARGSLRGPIAKIVIVVALGLSVIGIVVIVSKKQGVK